MAYHIDMVKSILKKYAVDPKIALSDIDEETINRETLFILWFCYHGWSVSYILPILDDIDRHEDMKNLYGDGI